MVKRRQRQSALRSLARQDKTYLPSCLGIGARLLAWRLRRLPAGGEGARGRVEGKGRGVGIHRASRVGRIADVEKERLPRRDAEVWAAPRLAAAPSF